MEVVFAPLLALMAWAKDAATSYANLVSMIILAHRGWWPEPTEKSDWTASQRDLAGGFGFKTKVGDHGGEFVITHDPPTGDLQLSDLLELYRSGGGPGAVAVTIRSDVFDMSTRDAIDYIEHGFDVFARHSDHEMTLAIHDEAADA